MMRIDAVLASTLAAVVDEGTLDAAARRLHVTPSAVSQRLKLLEEQVGQRLLVRSKPVRATPAGRVVVRFARQVTLAEHEVGVELGLADTGGWTRLAIAVNADSLATWLLDGLVAVAADHRIELELLREDQEHTARLLEEGLVVAAVTAPGTPVPGCRSTPLGTIEFVAVAAPSWIERWAPDGVTSEVLATTPRIDYDRDDRVQHAWLQERGVDPLLAPRHLVPSVHDIARAVDFGLGWAMIPRDRADPLVADGLLVSLGGEPFRMPLVWQRWKDPSPLLDELTDRVLAAARGAR